jgi:hypothetical protein
MTKKSKAKRWRVLVGSKRKITLAITGEDPGPAESLKVDALYGAEAVADYSGLTLRQVYHQKERLGLRPIGLRDIGTRAE